MTLDLDELERVARAAIDKPWDRSGEQGEVIENLWSRAEGCVGGTEFYHREDAEHISALNPSVALELIRLARLGKWAEEVGVASLKTITLQRMSRHVDIGILANFTLSVAQEALDHLPKYTVEVLDE